MEEVDGIILILSCQKHKLTRLKEFGPKNKYYDKWKVIIIIGDLFLDSNYKLIDNIMYIKCEDSYLHLLKKLALSIKYIKNCFNIKEGILRCGDDLIFNDDVLINFLKSKKYDFYGKSTIGENKIIDNIEFLKTVNYDSFMYDYYLHHKTELTDPKHGIDLTLDELNKYLVRPKIWGPAGVVYYISLKCCDIIVNTMEKIDYNIFHLDEFTNSYPYLIEDVGITFIMYFNKINFMDNKYIYGEYGDNNSIAIHTNKYK